MFAKRIRNKKLENNIEYSVKRAKEVKDEFLIEYQFSNLKTGIEQDEEKELDLTLVLKGGKKEILIPKIIKNEELDDQNENKFEEQWVRPEKFVKSTKDCENELELDDKQLELLQKNKIDLPVFHYVMKKINEKGADAYNTESDTFFHHKTEEKTINEPKQKEEPKNVYESEEKQKIVNKEEEKSESLVTFGPEKLKKVKNFILKNFSNHLLLINDTCFRKLTTHVIRKSRRTETSTIDKLRRMWSELKMVDELVKMKSEQTEINRKISEIDLELLKISKNELSDILDRKKVYKHVYKEYNEKILPFCDRVPLSELRKSTKRQEEIKKILLNHKNSKRSVEQRSTLKHRTLEIDTLRILSKIFARK